LHGFGFRAPEGRKRVAQGDGEAGALGFVIKKDRALEEGDRSFSRGSHGSGFRAPEGRKRVAQGDGEAGALGFVIKKTEPSKRATEVLAADHTDLDLEPRRGESV
jgi:hypothetical protein